MTDDTFTRRTTLARLGSVVLAAAGGGSLLTDEASEGNLAVESGAVSCVLTPELSEGALGVDEGRRAQGGGAALTPTPRPPSAHFRHGGCRRTCHCGTAGVHDRRGGRSEAVSSANRDSARPFPPGVGRISAHSFHTSLTTAAVGPVAAGHLPRLGA
jgi:hypothetical protein